MTDLAGRRIFVAGHRGLLGRALLRRLEQEEAILLVADRERLDLRDQAATRAWLAAHRPELVFVAAARVGGLGANRDHPAEFLFDNAMIAANLIDGSYRAGVAKLVFVGSSALYPRDAPQPIVEGALLQGPPDPLHDGYAVAKIAAVKLCELYRRQYGCDFIAALPTNLYGPHDNFRIGEAHVLPALLRRTHEAKRDGAATLTIWGTGAARREFLHCDDCADALVHLARHYSAAEPINVGSGDEVSILDLARLIADVVGYRGAIETDRAKPDGMPRRALDSSRLFALGWRPRMALRDGIAATYGWYMDGQREARL